MSMCAPERFTARSLLFLVFALLLVADVWAADLHEGEWRLVSKTEVAGAAYAMPAMSYYRCISRSMMIPAQELPGRQCELVDEQRSGGRYSWRMRCQSKDKEMQVFGEAVYDGDRMQGSVRLVSGNITRISHIQGERIGSCR